MPVNATTKFTLRTFAATADQKAFLKAALTEVARGDTLALDALQEQTHLPPEQLKAAAEAFVSNNLDQVFAGDRPVKRDRILGTTAPPKVTPGRGPSADQLETVGRQVHSLELQIVQARTELTALENQAELDAKAAEKAEVGFFGDMIFWSKANKQENAAREKAEESAARIAPQEEKIADLEEQVELTLRGLLANVRDVDYVHIAGRLQQVEDVRGEVARTLKVLAAASRAAEDVTSDEEGEMFWGGRDFWIPGTDLPEGSNALSASQAVILDCNRAIEKYNQTNPNQPLETLQQIPHVETYEGIDNAVDVLAGVAGALGSVLIGGDRGRALGRGVGTAAATGMSAVVRNQVAKIKGHIDQRWGSADGVARVLESRHKEIRAQMDNRLDVLRESALEAAGHRAA